MPFYGANRPGAKVSQGLRESFWLQGMQAGFKNVFDCIKAFSETDQTEDLRKLNVPTLLIHGDDDQIVPIGASAHAAVKIAPKVQLKVYPGAPHGLCSTTRTRSTRICLPSSRHEVLDLGVSWRERFPSGKAEQTLSREADTGRSAGRTRAGGPGRRRSGGLRGGGGRSGRPLRGLSHATTSASWSRRCSRAHGGASTPRVGTTGRRRALRRGRRSRGGTAGALARAPGAGGRAADPESSTASGTTPCLSTKALA